MGADISSVGLVSAAANHPSKRLSGSLSGTALADIYARRLQLGDPGGEIRKAFDAFGRLVPTLAGDIDRLYAAHHIPGGKAPDALFRGLSMAGMTPPRDVQILTVAATFAHVWRAKQAAPGRPVGINFLRKIERPLLYGFYGAALAEVDWVVMGAGDPSEAPGWLERLARHEPVELSPRVATVPAGTHKIVFDPKELTGGKLAPLRRPSFIAIISSYEQAAALASSDVTRPDGFVVEGPLAGGHNAPPKKKARDKRGYYVYGPEDEADVVAIGKLGLPYWSAGGCGYPEKPASPEVPPRRRQVGTLFGLAAESGMVAETRRRVLQLIWQQKLEVVTDVRASPSSFPFKVALVPGTIADPAVYAERPRLCNVGHLRGWRPQNGVATGLCPASDPELYKKMGGAAWRIEGAICLCNGLLATCGVGQPCEQALVTLGDIGPVRELQRRLHRIEYSAQEAIAFMFGEL